VRTEGLDELIIAVLVKYIVFEPVGREQEATVVERRAAVRKQYVIVNEYAVRTD
jgi:hypothetical protein